MLRNRERNPMQRQVWKRVIVGVVLAAMGASAGGCAIVQVSGWLYPLPEPMPIVDPNVPDIGSWKFQFHGNE
jgi:hypothetical protein